MFTLLICIYCLYIALFFVMLLLFAPSAASYGSLCTHANRREANQLPGYRYYYGTIAHENVDTTEEEREGKLWVCVFEYIFSSRSINHLLSFSLLIRVYIVQVSYTSLATLWTRRILM